MREYRRFLGMPALLALAGLLAGCSMPPYNEELSLAQVTRSKLGQPLDRIGPIYTKLDDTGRQTPFTFLPDRNGSGSMGGGFLVATTTYGLRVWYLAYFSSYGGLSGSWAIGLENASGTSNNYLLQPTRSASGALNLVRYFPSTGYLSNELIQIHATDPLIVSPGTSQPLSGLLGAAYPPPPTMIAAGTSIYPMADPSTFDMQYFLAYGLETGTYVEFKSQTNESSGVVSPTVMYSDFTLSPLPPDLRNVFYGRADSIGLSYLSYWSASEGKYKSYSWSLPTLGPPPVDPPNLKLLSGVKGRIDAVLTSGQLLSFEDNGCTVYDSAGNKLFDFPLGGLKFCYERWDPSSVPPQFKLYFSLAYWLYGRDEKADQLYVEVYAIPTANLSSLR